MSTTLHNRAWPQALLPAPSCFEFESVLPTLWPPSLSPTPICSVYSFGVMMWEVYCGETPAVLNQEAERLQYHPLFGSFDQDTPRAYVELAIRCLAAGPENRPTLGEICRDLEAMLAAWMEQQQEQQQQEDAEEEGPVNAAAGVGAVGAAAGGTYANAQEPTRQAFPEPRTEPRRQGPCKEVQLKRARQAVAESKIRASQEGNPHPQDAAATQPLHLAAQILGEQADTLMHQGQGQQEPKQEQQEQGSSVQQPGRYESQLTRASLSGRLKMLLQSAEVQADPFYVLPAARGMGQPSVSQERGVDMAP